MPKTMPSFWEEVTVADVVSNVFVEAATLAFVFFLGAAVGSFVNVILYRMPRRINLLWPPSRCPACLNRLKLVDNTPVVGWLRLRGKCRHCGAPIPRSYLRVEVGFGLLFLALLYVEIHTGGWNLPLRAPNAHLGALWNLWYPRPDLVRIWAYHMALVGVLGTLFLFARRGEQLPGLFVAAALAAGVLPTVWLAGLHQVPWAGLDGRDATVWRLTGVTDAVVGAAGGALAGAVLGGGRPVWADPVSAERARLAVPPRWNSAVVLAVAGAWLGWQAALSVAVLTAAFGVARPEGARRHWPLAQRRFNSSRGAYSPNSRRGGPARTRPFSPRPGGRVSQPPWLSQRVTGPHPSRPKNRQQTHQRQQKRRAQHRRLQERTRGLVAKTAHEIRPGGERERCCRSRSITI